MKLNSMIIELCTFLQMNKIKRHSNDCCLGSSVFCQSKTNRSCASYRNGRYWTFLQNFVCTFQQLLSFNHMQEILLAYKIECKVVSTLM